MGSANLKRSVGDMNCMVVTFAHWEEGFIVRQDNPKKIRAITDVVKPTVRISIARKVQARAGSWTNSWRPAALSPAGLRATATRSCHTSTLRRESRRGLVDAGIGVQSVASICGLDFVPLERGTV